MCGLAGVFGPGCGAPERARARALGAALAHRGPDEDGEAAFDDAVLAHRRLSIRDLSPAAAQPMTHASGAVLVYNGELYNGAELRLALEAAGERFTGTGDTEIVLAACVRFGMPEALARLEGIFALALYDPRERALWLARDRCGVKPLFLARGEDGRTWFASELGPLVRHAPLPRRVDAGGLGAYALLGFVPGPGTIWSGVAALGPGRWLRLDLEGPPRQGSIPAPPAARGETGAAAAEGPGAPSYDEAVARVRTLVEESVARQLVSDVPLGAFLSGGLDSSIVCAAVTRRLGRDLATFSIGYHDDPVIDESAWAELVAGELGTRHTTFRVSADDLRDAAGPALAGLGQPFADPSLVPTYLVARLARRHVTVALSGDGADELFAGYSKYLAESEGRRWRRTPAPLRAGVAAALAVLPATRSHRFGEAVRRARKFAATAALPAVERWIALQALLRPPARAAALYRAPLDTGALAARVEALLGGRDGIDGMRAVDLSLTLPDRMLFKVDHASMAVGLEVRVPLLDDRLAAFARGLPAEYLLQGRTRKRVLRDACLPWLPAALARRPKQGFDAPIGRWLAGPLREAFLDRVRSASAASLLDAGRVERLLTRHAAAREAAEPALWAAYCAATWADEFRPAV